MIKFSFNLFLKEENKINDENSLEKKKNHAVAKKQTKTNKQTNKQTEQVFSLNFFLIVKVSTTPVIKGDDICERSKEFGVVRWMSLWRGSSLLECGVC